MADLAARHLIQQGAKTLLVCNRTESRAQAIADNLRTAAITTGVIPIDQLHAESHRADIVITSTGAGQVFRPEDARALLQRRRNRPVFFIDIAVPRDVAPEVNQVENCFVYDIDDLQQLASQNQAVRSKEAEAAESIVSSEVARYNDRLAQAPTVEAIKQLLADAEALRLSELNRLTASQPLDPAQLAAIDQLTKSLTARLLHPQIAALRRANKSSDSDK
jgi:glutamyl-tRNA reductase